MPRPALITGITGQGGSYLAELLLAKGYEALRKSFVFNSLRAHRPAAAVAVLSSSVYLSGIRAVVVACRQKRSLPKPPQLSLLRA